MGLWVQGLKAWDSFYNSNFYSLLTLSTHKHIIKVFPTGDDDKGLGFIEFAETLKSKL